MKKKFCSILNEVYRGSFLPFVLLSNIPNISGEGKKKRCLYKPSRPLQKIGPIVAFVEHHYRPIWVIAAFAIVAIQ